MSEINFEKDQEEILDKTKNIKSLADQIKKLRALEDKIKSDEETLKETQYTQPAIFVHSIIVDKFLKEKDIRANAVAGHSLGEFSALVSADVLSFESALEIVKVRSSEMAQAGKNAPGTMAAILGADDDQLKIICQQNGVVVPANINAPGQVVISGEIKAIENAIITAKKIGIRRALALNVSGAFHSPLMAPARQPLLDVIDSIEFNNAKIPVYQNVSASPVTNAAAIRDNILNQLENPVLWCDTILNLKQMGITDFYEVGPGKVLKGLNRQIFPESTTITCDKLEHLDACEVL